MLAKIIAGTAAIVVFGLAAARVVAVPTAKTLLLAALMSLNAAALAEEPNETKQRSASVNHSCPDGYSNVGSSYEPPNRPDQSDQDEQAALDVDHKLSILIQPLRHDRRLALNG
jgi:hypothetical protein